LERAVSPAGIVAGLGGDGRRQQAQGDEGSGDNGLHGHLLIFGLLAPGDQSPAAMEIWTSDGMVKRISRRRETTCTVCEFSDDDLDRHVLRPRLLAPRTP